MFGDTRTEWACVYSDGAVANLAPAFPNYFTRYTMVVTSLCSAGWAVFGERAGAYVGRWACALANHMFRVHLQYMWV